MTGPTLISVATCVVVVVVVVVVGVGAGLFRHRVASSVSIFFPLASCVWFDEA